jgi:hypothetical protein
MSVRAIVAIVVATCASCTLLTNTSGLSGGADPGDAASASDAGGIVDAAVEAIAASCRGIKEKVPAAPTGMYPLLDRDGGFYCDMDSFGGGWTLVRHDMVNEGKTQDIDPTSPNPVDVFSTTDAHGGASWTVTVLANNCNSTPNAPSMHWAMFDELDNWQQIMATYTFSGDGNCWNIFSPLDVPNVPDLNTYSFDPLIDNIDRQQNMARTADGSSIPYDGKMGYCGAGLENFWRDDYRAQPRTARIVLRRRLRDKPAGLGVLENCGMAAWQLTEVFVR